MSSELREITAQDKLAEWAGKITACRNSGQAVKTWCRENGVCEQTYYKWLKRLVTIAQEQQKVQFAEVTPSWLRTPLRKITSTGGIEQRFR